MQICEAYRGKYSPQTVTHWQGNYSRHLDFQRELTQLLLCVVKWKSKNQLWVAAGRIIVNGVMFSPKLPQKFISKLPYDTRRQIKHGKYAMLIDFSLLASMRNLTYIKIDDVDFCYIKIGLDFDLDLDFGHGFSFEPQVIFERIPSLRVLEVEGEFILKEDLKGVLQHG